MQSLAVCMSHPGNRFVDHQSGFVWPTFHGDDSKWEIPTKETIRIPRPKLNVTDACINTHVHMRTYTFAYCYTHMYVYSIYTVTHTPAYMHTHTRIHTCDSYTDAYTCVHT